MKDLSMLNEVSARLISCVNSGMSSTYIDPAVDEFVRALGGLPDLFEKMTNEGKLLYIVALLTYELTMPE